MSQAIPFAPFKPTKLIQWLDDLDVVKASLDHKRFAERLGELIQLFDSFTLSDKLRSIPRIQAQNSSTDVPDELAQITNIKEAIVAKINQSVDLSSTSRPKAPQFDTDSEMDMAEQRAAMRRFYSIMQRDMAAAALKCRKLARSQLLASKATHAQLASLDQALESVLDKPLSRALGKMPGFLEGIQQTYIELSDNCNQGQFYETLRALMLAECEFRFTPVMGLLDALNQEDINID